MRGTIGIDIGTSASKAVLLSGGKIHCPCYIPHDGKPFTAETVLGRYLSDSGLGAEEIFGIALTGIGSVSAGKIFPGKDVAEVDEFTANVCGAKLGMMSMGREDVPASGMVVVSMGTGTSFIRFSDGEARRLGGLAVGGGTLKGLSSLIFGSGDVSWLEKKSLGGNVAGTDLLVSDFCGGDCCGLPADVSVSNMAKVSAETSGEDVAFGLVNMVLQAIGCSANFIAGSTSLRDFVLIGGLAGMRQCRTSFDRMAELFGIRFHYPEHPEFLTAAGAACVLFEKYK